VSAAAVAHAAHRHAPRTDGYARRRPEDTVLHSVVRAHWPAFLERAEEAGGLPKFVVREFEAYLECGLLEHGLVHLQGRDCGEDLVVAWSCKRRGFCPSCVARRMSDAAANLVENVMTQCTSWIASVCCRIALGRRERTPRSDCCYALPRSRRARPRATSRAAVTSSMSSQQTPR